MLPLHSCQKVVPTEAEEDVAEEEEEDSQEVAEVKGEVAEVSEEVIAETVLREGRMARQEA